VASEFIYVYQTICSINNKSYVGVHRTKNLNDRYIGGGLSKGRKPKLDNVFHRAVRKHGYASFKTHILSFYDTYQEALDEERFIVNDKWVKDTNNYNTAIGGGGNTTSWMDESRKKEWKNNLSISVKRYMDNGGRDRIKDIVTLNLKKMFGKDNPMYGTKNPHCQKPILQYDLNMKFIKRFSNLTDAASEVNAFISSISYCCIGVNKSTKGFIFRFENYTDKDLLKLNSNLDKRKKGGQKDDC
jgi:hypothetical protein